MTPQEVIDLFWSHVATEDKGTWHDLAAVGWVVDDIVLVVFKWDSTTAVYYRVTAEGLEGYYVPRPSGTVGAGRSKDPRTWIEARAKDQ